MLLCVMRHLFESKALGSKWFFLYSTFWHWIFLGSSLTVNIHLFKLTILMSSQIAWSMLFCVLFIFLISWVLGNSINILTPFTSQISLTFFLFCTAGARERKAADQESGHRCLAVGGGWSNGEQPKHMYHHRLPPKAVPGSRVSFSLFFFFSLLITKFSLDLNIYSKINSWKKSSNHWVAFWLGLRLVFVWQWCSCW
jgi:hypothetical protein